jgi:hypothetical protein
VDVVTMIEAERGGVAIPHIIRAANHKTFRQIHDEIRSVQTRPARSRQRSSKLSVWECWFRRQRAMCFTGGW